MSQIYLNTVLSEAHYETMDAGGAAADPPLSGCGTPTNMSVQVEAALICMSAVVQNVGELRRAAALAEMTSALRTGNPTVKLGALDVADLRDVLLVAIRNVGLDTRGIFGKYLECVPCRARATELLIVCPCVVGFVLIMVP